MQPRHLFKRIDFDWALGLNRFTLSLMGVWPHGDISKDKSLKVVLRVPFMICTMFFGLFLPQMYALSLVIKELSLVLDNVMTSSATLSCCVKLYFLWHNKEVLRPVVQSVTQDWLRKKDDWEHEIMVREAGRARIYTIGGLIALCYSYVWFGFAPLIGVDVRVITNITDYGERHLIVQTYYPYDYSQSPHFELTHISQIVGLVFLVVAVSVPDNYFGALIFHTSAQFEILGIDIESLLKVNKETEVSQQMRAKHFQNKLAVLVDRHSHLIRMVDAMERSFTLVILAQMCGMFIMVCCLGFRVLELLDGNPSTLQVIILISTLLSLLIHTFIDCLGCDLLMLCNEEISFRIYNCRWCTVHRRTVRNLIPMMVMSKNLKYLTAGKIFNLSLQTYCSILKTALGYISILIAVDRR